ncbi:MAG TPA: PP2C family serine/threonine-protein phosphatase [Burkholderiaceae bacterium]|jgi:protein phosphatase|nr:PP2C family serine/threonine-protein phosphatase [Burkholderiaceae bacterium]
MPEFRELALNFALKSHPGRIRPLNEDAVGADPEIGLFILADGLGGYNAGEVASTMTVSMLLTDLGAQLARANGSADTFDPTDALRSALVAMNSAIFRAALNSAAYEGMATTVVIAWFLGGRLWVAHAGDSRLYRLRDGVLEQITRDHSFSQELVDAGMVSAEEARVLPAKNLVTKALGATPELEPEVHDYDVLPGDIVLMCSDGLTEMVSPLEIGGLITGCGYDVVESARRLIDLANEAGGRDNTSVILVRVAAPDEGLEAEEEQVPAELDDSVQAAEVVLRLPDPVVH